MLSPHAVIFVKGFTEQQCACFQINYYYSIHPTVCGVLDTETVTGMNRILSNYKL